MPSPPRSPRPPSTPNRPNEIQPLPLRAGGFRFVPFSDEASLSTRGQHLPQIIQSRSYTNLPDLHRVVSSPRKSSFFFRDRSPLATSDSDPERGRRSSRFQEYSPGHEESFAERAGIVNSPLPSPMPPDNFPFTRDVVYDARRKDSVPATLMTAQMRSQRLIGNSNPRYRWGQYYKTEEQLKQMKKPLRKYYERNNYLIQQYLYIDRLLDSSLPHNLIQEYNQPHNVHVPPTIREEGASDSVSPKRSPGVNGEHPANETNGNGLVKVKRTPKDLYRVPDEETPLLRQESNVDGAHPSVELPAFNPEEETDSSDRVVTIAIYINLAANTALLAMKIIVTVLTSSLSVLASLVDAALDFLSTAIVWVTTHLISSGSTDTYNYPVGRRRLEPIGVLVFSVIMITSFFQVFLEAVQRLTSSDRTVVELQPSAIAIMAATVGIKFLCWLYCRLIRNSSVQALAQDAMTDMVFNTFSIIFPLVGYFANLWFLDPLGGLLLSLYVIFAWSRTTSVHIANLTGRAASKDERNILLYLTMRFAHTIRYIQSLSAYHAGDKLNVEVDIVLDEEMSLRDSHDLSESLQYVLESVPGVERAFVHADYRSVNLPSHMQQ